MSDIPLSSTEHVARLEHEVSVLRLVSSRVNSTLRLEEIYEAVLDSLAEAFGFEHVLILLQEEDGSFLRVVAGRGYPRDILGATLEVGLGVIGTVALRRRMMQVGNLAERRAYVAAIRQRAEEDGQAERLEAAPEIPGIEDAESQIAIPLVVGELLVGVLFVECRHRSRFSAHEEALVTIVANLCAAAIRNAQLYSAEERHRKTLEGTVAQRNHELSRVKELREKEARRFTFSDLVGSSEVMRELRRLLEKVVESPASTILVVGENGTGKDMVAKIAHAQSQRSQEPFMNITCSALAPSLLESELFGHERGAFTDAHKLKKGLLELADGGTVFLDEIAELTVPLQTRLLRFLEDKTFKRVGGATDIRVDVRIVAATNRDLPRMVEEGAFREDLYYRLRVLEIELPPLRERTGDVRELVELFLGQFNRQFNKQVTEVAPDLIAELEAYPWPGNVRELRNTIERGVLLAEGSHLCRGDLAVVSRRKREADEVSLPASGIDFEALERGLVLQALERCDWNKAHAARLLGMPRDWLRYRIEKFGLRPPTAA